MAKVQIKSEKLTPFGGIFSIMEQFDSTLSSVIDSTLGLRCRSFGYRSGVAVIGDLIVGIEFELNSILVEKWKGKAYRLVIQFMKMVKNI